MSGEATKAIDRSTLWGGGRSPFSVSYGKMMMWFFLVSDALTFSGLLVAYGYTRHSFTGAWPIGEEVFREVPGIHADLPLIYVAIMTFILIVSSITMVLAVEAGHRMDKKGVQKWMFLTILGGLFFLGSQAFEWTHFIEGTPGYIITQDNQKAWLSEEVPDGASAATVKDFSLIMDKGEKDEHVVSGSEAVSLYDHRLEHVSGANLHVNEYGPPSYADFFFFITGFHGFHVFSGVMLNFIIFLGVVRGTYEKRGHYEMVEKVGLYWHFVDLVWVFVFTFFYLI